MSINSINSKSGFKLWLIIALCMVTAGGVAMLTHTGRLLVLDCSVQSVISRPWTLFTYIWIHADLWHLMLNLLWLGVFIYAARGIIGNVATAAIFITGGVCGGAAYLIYGASAHAYGGALVGASAAILAVGAALPAVDTQTQMKLFGGKPVNICVIMVPVIVIAGIISVYDRPGSLSAHAGGVAGGVIFGYLYRYFARKPERVVTDDSEKTRLLDKVRRSGYESLTRSERLTLSRLSKN